jgi:hypothetical protein
MASPRPLPFGKAAVERLKQLRKFFLGNAGALVLDGQHEAGARRVVGALQLQPPPVGHGAEAVGRQVPDDLLDLALVGVVPELGWPAGRRLIRCWSCRSALLRRSSAVSLSARRASNRFTSKRCGRA